MAWLTYPVSTGLKNIAELLGLGTNRFKREVGPLAAEECDGTSHRCFSFAEESKKAAKSVGR